MRAKLEGAYARRALAEQSCPHWELETGSPPEPFVRALGEALIAGVRGAKELWIKGEL